MDSSKAGSPAALKAAPMDTFYMWGYFTTRKPFSWTPETLQRKRWTGAQWTLVSHSVSYSLLCLVCPPLCSEDVIFLVCACVCRCFPTCYLGCLIFWLLPTSLSAAFLVSPPLLLLFFLSWLPTHSFLHACVPTNGGSRCSPRWEPLKALASAPRQTSPLCRADRTRSSCCTCKVGKHLCLHEAAVSASGVRERLAVSLDTDVRLCRRRAGKQKGDTAVWGYRPSQWMAWVTRAEPFCPDEWEAGESSFVMRRRAGHPLRCAFQSISNLFLCSFRTTFTCTQRTTFISREKWPFFVSHRAGSISTSQLLHWTFYSSS